MDHSGNGEDTTDHLVTGLTRVAGRRCPDQYQEVRLAFSDAVRQRPQAGISSRVVWSVAVCNAWGEVAARGTFWSFDQVCSFALALERIGCYQALFTEHARNSGCDLLLQPTPSRCDAVLLRRP